LSDWLPFVVTGLTSGSVYALAALGLVLTQRTSGVFNFAHGAVAAAGAFGFNAMWDIGLPWPIAAALAIGVLAPLIGLILEALTRSLGGRSRPGLQVVATVGILLAIQGTLSFWSDGIARSVPPFLPTGTFRMVGINVGADQLITVAIAAAGAAGLSALLARTRLGIAMRGVVDDPDLLGLSGTDPNRVRRLSWMIGASFAALSGILIAPFLGLDALLLTLLVIQAFGAAAIGRFSNLPLTYAGGLAIGVAVALSTKMAATVPGLSGLPPSIPFLVLFAVLVVLPKRLPRMVHGRGRQRRGGGRSPGSVRWALLAGAAVLIAVPHVVGAKLPLFLTGAAMALVFLSLGLLVWTAGQVSLAHAAFVAVGATSMSHFTAGAGLPWFVALLLAGLVAVPVGAVVAIPAIRLSGVYLALATFGFGILFQQLIYPLGAMFGELGFRRLPRPSLAGLGTASDTAYFYVVVLVVALGALLVHVLLRSRLGRMLRAVSDSPIAMTTHGASVNVSLTLVFCLSAFLAAVAGALLGGVTESATGAPLGPFQSLTWLAVVTIAGRSPLASGVTGALLLSVVPGYVDAGPYVQTLTFGLLAVVAAMVADSQAAHDFFGRLQASSGDRLRHSPVRTRTDDLRRFREAAEATP